MFAKFVLGTTMLLSSVAFSEGRRPEINREQEVIQFFIQEANKPSSEMGKVLQSSREARMNGFRQNPEDVMPLTLSSSDLKVMTTVVDEYDGTFRGGDDSDPGYHNITYLIGVDAGETWYGGRINITSKILFECQSDKGSNERRSRITCSAVEIKKKESSQDSTAQ